MLFSSTSESNRTLLAVGSLPHGRHPETSELARGKVLKDYEDDRSRLRTRQSRFASRRTGRGGASHGPCGFGGGTTRVTRSRAPRSQGGPKPSPWMSCSRCRSVGHRVSCEHFSPLHRLRDVVVSWPSAVVRLETEVTRHGQLQAGRGLRRKRAPCGASFCFAARDHSFLECPFVLTSAPRSVDDGFPDRAASHVYSARD